MKTIIVTSAMGGAGKSLVCAGLGLALANTHHTAVLLELGRRSLDTMFDTNAVYDTGDWLEERCSLSDCTLKYNDNLHLLAGISGANTSEHPPLTVTENHLSAIECLSSPPEFLIAEVPAPMIAHNQDLCRKAHLCLIVCAPDSLSARENRSLCDLLFDLQAPNMGLYINPLQKNFAAERPIPHLDYLIDKVCARLWGILPFSERLSAPEHFSQKFQSNLHISQPFYNLAQRIMEKHIDLWIS